MKLSILNSGIEQPIKASIQDAKSSLNSNNYVSLICPPSFSYSSYIGGLKNKTSKFSIDVNKIIDYASKHENSYDDLFYSHKNIFSNVPNPSLKLRSGLTNKIEDLAQHDVKTGGFKSIMEIIEGKMSTNYSNDNISLPKLKSKD